MIWVNNNTVAAIPIASWFGRQGLCYTGGNLDYRVEILRNNLAKITEVLVFLDQNRLTRTVGDAQDAVGDFYKRWLRPCSTYRGIYPGFDSYVTIKVG